MKKDEAYHILTDSKCETCRFFHLGSDFCICLLQQLFSSDIKTQIRSKDDWCDDWELKDAKEHETGYDETSD